jgi:hypothetical protein
MTLSKMILSITALGKMALSITALEKMTLGIISLSLTKLSLTNMMPLSTTNLVWNVVMLNVVKLKTDFLSYVETRYAE